MEEQEADIRELWFAKNGKVRWRRFMEDGEYKRVK